jgi:hypothetical protein
MRQRSVREVFGTEARISSLLLRTAPGVDVPRLARQLQGQFLSNGFVVTDVQTAVRGTYAANTQIFRLMQGYLALGLLVAITGLGQIALTVGPGSGRSAGRDHPARPACGEHQSRYRGPRSGVGTRGREEQP